MIDMHLHSAFSTEAKDTFMLRRIARGARDLKTSSSISDKGALDPMLEAAAQKGLKAVAITDHWSLDGLESGRRKAESLGMEYINGIEIASLLESGGTGFEVHILAYYFNPEDEGLRALCADARRTCMAGAEAFLEGLAALNIAIARADVIREYPGSVSGWALRRMLVDRGYARNKAEATMLQQRAVAASLESGSAACGLAEQGILEAGDIIPILHRAGATVFMAHPFWLNKPQHGGWPDDVIWRMIESMLALGIDGLEAYSLGGNNDLVEEFCRRNQIPACGGSDSHNVNGLLRAKTVDGDFLESIKRYRRKLKPWA